MGKGYVRSEANYERIKWIKWVRCDQYQKHIMDNVVKGVLKL